MTNTSRLADLRDRNEFDELVILTSKPEDLPSLFDAGNLTVAQFLIVSELLTSMHNVSAQVRAAQTTSRIKSLIERLSENNAPERESASGVYPYGQTETRASGPYNGDNDPFRDDDSEDEDNDPFRLSPADRSEASPSEAGELFRKLFEPGGALSGDPDVMTVNGPVRMSTIPKDADGGFSQAWVDENCPCDDHEGKRADAAQLDADRARGGFREEYPEADRPGLYV
jgi:hypothetical protein